MGSAGWFAMLLALSGCRYFLGAAGTASDASDAPSDDPRCRWGSAGLPQGGICLDELPTADRTLMGSLNTDASELCAAYTLGGGQYCVVTGANVEIDDLIVSGAKPLVVIATSSIRVAGELDVAARADKLAAPGGDPNNGCDPGALPSEVTSGGAGGSFAGPGGQGELAAAGTSTARGIAGMVLAFSPPAVLRGGCRGQTVPGTASRGGAGGGAVDLIAGARVTVEAAGSIDASGDGGDGGALATGGAGGGAGGMIVLDAPAVDLTGAVYADGGGGGEGGGNNQPGMDGGVSTGVGPALGGASNVNGGDGGNGAHATVNGANATVTDRRDSGGGGGGGSGLIWIHAATRTGSETSPPATSI